MDIEQAFKEIKEALGTLAQRMDAVDANSADKASNDALLQRISQLEADRDQATQGLAQRERRDKLNALIGENLTGVKLVDRDFVVSHLMSLMGDAKEDKGEWKVGGKLVKDLVGEFMDSPAGKSLTQVEQPPVGSGHPTDTRQTGQPAKKSLGQTLREVNW